MIPAQQLIHYLDTMTYTETARFVRFCCERGLRRPERDVEVLMRGELVSPRRARSLLDAWTALYARLDTVGDERELIFEEIREVLRQLDGPMTRDAQVRELQKLAATFGVLTNTSNYRTMDRIRRGDVRQIKKGQFYYLFSVDQALSLRDALREVYRRETAAAPEREDVFDEIQSELLRFSHVRPISLVTAQIVTRGLPISDHTVLALRAGRGRLRLPRAARLLSILQAI